MSIELYQGFLLLFFGLLIRNFLIPHFSQKGLQIDQK